MSLPITAHGWITLAACAGELALVLLTLLRGARSRLALPLTLFSLDLFFWNFAALAYEVSGIPAWNWLDHATSPLSTPLALHFVLIFVGRRRQLRWLIAFAYAAFGLVSACSALSFFFSWARHFTGSPAWAAVNLGLLIPVVLFGIGCLIVHARRSASPDERARTRLLLAGFAVLAILGSTELLGGLGVRIPPLGNVGVLACNTMMAVVALRFRLFEQSLTSVIFWNAIAFAAVGLGAYVAVFHFRGTMAAILVLSCAIFLFALAVAGLQVRTSLAIRRERLQRMATLGRFSAQMAHDLKNPLTALKGAAQYLMEGLRRGQPTANQSEFVKLMLEQIDRITAVVEEYQRLARIEPVFGPVKVNDVVREVLALQAFADPTGRIMVRTDLDGQLPTCVGDRQLLSGALENLVRNAFEAMPSGGELTVRTTQDVDDRLVIAVEDTGEGMDPRTRERAFDDFYTTKPQGTGLGLTFARRVAEAHGGVVLLTSREGLGTVVRLDIPLNHSSK